jgi:hypothetical protein
MGFTDFGGETLTSIVKIYKADPELLKRGQSTRSDSSPAAQAACLHQSYHSRADLSGARKTVPFSSRR